MLVTSFVHFAPRSIMQARTARAVHLGRIVRIGLRRLARRTAAFRARLALARQYESELVELLQADDRMLADIGLTRADVVAAAQSRWFLPTRMTEAAAQRRNGAMRMAAERHALPRVVAPSLTPGAPARFLAVETSNYR